MKGIAPLLAYIGIKKAAKKTLEQYKEEVLFKEGREQFIQIIKRGLQVPVSVL